MEGYWTLPRSLTSADPSFYHLSVCSEGDTIHFFYRNGTNLRYRKSTDRGVTFTAETTIAQTNETPLVRCSAVSGNNVYILYMDETSTDLKFRRSTNGGTSWSAESTFATTSLNYWRLAMVASGSIVHVVYTAEDNSTFTTNGMFYKKSTDSGATFSAATQLFAGTAVSPTRPDLAMNGSILHLTWTDMRFGTLNNGGEVFYGKSTNAGSSWSETRMTTTPNKDNLRSSISCDDAGHVNLIWQYPINTEDLWAIHSANDGTTWSSSTLLTPGNGSSISEHAYLAQSGQYACCVWADYRYASARTFASFSKDWGATWTNEHYICIPPSGTPAPQLVAHANGIFTGVFSTQSSGIIAQTGYAIGEPKQNVLLDDFNRTNQGPPPSTNWSAGVLVSTGGLVVLSNAVARASTGGYRQGDFYNVQDFDKDTTFIADLSSFTNTNGNAFSLYTRMNPVTPPASANGYSFNVDLNGSTGIWYISKVTGGVTTTLGSAVTHPAALNDLVAVRNTGNTKDFFRKASGTDAPWNVVVSASDATYTGDGKFGIELMNNQQLRFGNIWYQLPATLIAQTLVPVADSVDGLWTDQAGGTNLFAAIDEIPASNTDYIKSDLLTSGTSACRVKLAAGLNPGITNNHFIAWRVAKNASSSATIGMTVKLYQGGGNVIGGGTLIATFTRSNLTTTITEYTEALSGAQAASITDYSNLYLEFSATAT